MTNANHFCRLSFRVATLAVLGFFLIAASIGDTHATNTKRNVHFDHIKTGFPLTGAHALVPCETCHVQGTFRGTPKKCATCHTPGSRIQTSTVKPSNHIPTIQPCEQCHTSTASWNVASFSHVGVVLHQCGRCHNGTMTTGKPANHTPTTAPCDACHRTTTWMSAAFTHIGVTPGSCASCHTPGGSATGKPNNHIPTTLSCDACHTTGGTFMTSTFTHSATQGVIPGQCATCHNGSFTGMNALGKPAGHPATTASCDSCHTSFQSFATATFDHSGVTPGGCATCHTQGGSGMAKPSNHIPTSLSCDLCHTTGGTFTTSTFTHTAAQGVVAGQCATCHNGSYTQWNALGKPSGHVATTASCDACHTSGYTTFAGAGFNHTGVTPGTCATCHVQGGSGMAKPSDHIPTTLSCDACHNTSTFTTSTFSHTATQGVVAGQCATCHNGSYTQWNALGKPSGHVATTASCDACHTSGYTTFAGAGFNHTGVAPGTCATCHYPGGSGLAAPSNHIPYQSQLLNGASMSCDACHTSTTSFTIERMNHNNSLGNGAGWCKGCHASGTSYLGNMQKKSLTHQQSSGVTDCSQSGCHRPLGNKGTAYSNWD